MKSLVRTIVILSAGLLLGWTLFAQETTTKKGKSRKLRQPGFVFVELETKRLDESVAFFQDVMDFEETYRSGSFIQLETDHSELLLIHADEIPAGHPFHGKYKEGSQGVGVEIGLVVADLDKSFEAAKRHPAWTISSGVVRRPWGVRDFRVLYPDGYYLRFTEGEAAKTKNL